MQNERARIHVPQNGNIVPHEIILRRFARTPVGGDGGKFPDDERLDVRACGLLVIGVGPDVSNVRVSQADNLARVTRIGEDFLVSGEAGVENDFAAAPGDRSCGTAMKNAPIFERKNSLPSFSFRQWTLFLRPSAMLFGGQARRSPPRRTKVGYFTDSANTGIDPK
jgi:hypothetical protein